MTKELVEENAKKEQEAKEKTKGDDEAKARVDNLNKPQPPPSQAPKR